MGLFTQSTNTNGVSTGKLYSDDEKNKLKARLAALFRAEEGYIYAEMAEILNGEGFKKSNGQPHDSNSVMWILQSMGMLRGRGKGKKTKSKLGIVRASIQRAEESRSKKNAAFIDWATGVKQGPPDVLDVNGTRYVRADKLRELLG